MSLRSEVIRIFNELIGNAKKISELPAGTAPTGTELIEGVQGGVNKKFTVSQIASGGAGVLSVVAGTNVTVNDTDPQNPIVSASGGGGGAWGTITGTLSDQTDLNTALGARVLKAGDTMSGNLAMGSNKVTGLAAASGNGEAVRYEQLILKADAAGSKVIQIPLPDQVTPVSTGTAKFTFRMPFAMTVTAVRASLKTAQTSGSIVTFDINETGTTILSTKLTIDNTEKTSTAAATPAVISDSSLADDAEITIDVDQVGDGTAIGAIITLIGS